MNRYLLLNLFVVLLVASACHAGWYYGAVESGGEPPQEYLFHADFETDAQVPWDYTYGAEDCDGYDAGGDWCDYDSTQYHGGSHSLGCYSSNSSVVSKNIAGNSSEFYIDAWIMVTGLPATVYSFRVERSDTAYVLSVVILNTGMLYISHGGGPTQSDAGIIAPNTWYHIGIYVKQEVAPGSSGDGIIRAYLRTDSAPYTYSDVVLERTNTATGVVSADVFIFRGGATSTAHFYDDVYLGAGDPGWPDS